MTDHADENAQLAAWLAGDLDDAEGAALERRLDTEPALGARLDAMAATLARLRGYDAVELPADAAARLRTRLTAARRDQPSAAAPAHGTMAQDSGPAQGTTAAANRAMGAGSAQGAGRVTMPKGSDGGTRPGAARTGGKPPGWAGAQRPASGRGSRRARLAGIAVAVLLVVVGVGALLPVLNRGLGGETSDSAEMEVVAQDEGSASEESLAEASSERAGERAGEAGDAAAAAPSAASEEERAAELAAPAPSPVVVDAGAPLGLAAEAETAGEEDTAGPGEDALTARFLAVPEARALLGLPVEEAREVARAFVAELRAAPALASIGAAPSACLDTVLPEDTAVPARVEGFLLDGSPALAHVVVRATPGAQVLDVVDVVVTDPGTCAVVART